MCFVEKNYLTAVGICLITIRVHQKYWWETLGYEMVFPKSIKVITRFSDTQQIPLYFPYTPSTYKHTLILGAWITFLFQQVSEAKEL